MYPKATLKRAYLSDLMKWNIELHIIQWEQTSKRVYQIEIVQNRLKSMFI